MKKTAAKKNPPPSAHLPADDVFRQYQEHRESAKVESPVAGLAERASRLKELLLGIAENPDCRPEIAELARGLFWPVKVPDGIIQQPFLLTLGREDLCRRLWRQDGSETELSRRWATDAKVVFYVCLHTEEEFSRYYGDLRGQLLAVNRFYEEQIQSQDEKDLMCLVADVAWDSHRAFMIAPAPAVPRAIDRGN